MITLKLLTTPPRLPVKTGRMRTLAASCIALIGLLHTAAAARHLHQATLPTLAGERSTWAPAAQYASQRITVSPTNVAIAAAAAPAVFGMQQPASSIVMPNLNNAPVVSQYGGPGAGFPNIGNIPVITAKPAGVATAAVGQAVTAPPQLPASSSSSGSSSTGISVDSHARLPASVGALPVSTLSRLPIPSMSGFSNVANAMGNAVQSAAAATPTLNPSQLVAVAAVGAQRFVQNDLPKLIQSAAKDPNVQKGVADLLKDLADGKLDGPEIPKNLGDIAKSLNLGLPDTITEGLSSIKLPESLTDIKLPESLKPGQLPKLDLSRFNIPGFGPGGAGANGFSIPQIPGLTRSNNVMTRSDNDMLSGSRWTQAPIPKADKNGMTGVEQIDAAEMMLGGAGSNSPVNSARKAVNPDVHSGELGAGTFQGPDHAAAVAAGAAANRIKHNEQEDTNRRQQRAAAMRVKNGVRINANNEPAPADKSHKQAEKPALAAVAAAAAVAPAAAGGSAVAAAPQPESKAAVAADSSSSTTAVATTANISPAATAANSTTETPKAEPPANTTATVSPAATTGTTTAGPATSEPAAQPTVAANATAAAVSTSAGSAEISSSSSSSSSNVAEVEPAHTRRAGGRRHASKNSSRAENSNFEVVEGKAVQDV